MKVIARHGFISFVPIKADDLARFRRMFGVELKAERDYYTFQELAGLPRWSIAGAMYGNLPAIATYEGRDAAEVFEKNGFVYGIETGLLLPVATVLGTVTLNRTLNYILAPRAFLQPGVRVQTGQRLTGYQGFIDLDFQKLYLSSMELSL